MAEMTRRERILKVNNRERADKLPFLHNWRHMQTGWAEREARNRGMGISWARPSYVTRIHDVDISEQWLKKDGQTVYHRVFTTPVGTVYQDEMKAPGTGQWHGLRGWNDITPWCTARLIKEPEDYKVVKFIVEHTEYIADYYPLEQAKNWLGDEGVVMDIQPHQPMQTLMIDWVGSEGGRFFIHHAKYPDLVEELCQAISKSREPMYEIGARSPADLIWCGDNIDGVLVNPRLYEKYFLPEYEKMAWICHKHGKLLASHMDGRVGVLKDLIARTPLDIIEALHPPPMGDLSIGGALKAWPDKVIWVGFPGSVYAMGPKATKELALNLLRDTVPGERLCLEASTENIVSNENLLMLTSVLENAALPLTAEKIDRIKKSLD